MNSGEKLFGLFSPPSFEEWESIASAETSSADPAESLRWRTADNLSLLPYYTKHHAGAFEYLKNYTFNIGTVFSARHWLNVPLVTVSDERSANSAAIDHLHHEAEGVIFKTSQKNKINFNTLLKDISWQHCSVSFLADKFADADLHHFITASGFDPKKINGAIYHTDISLAGECPLPDSSFHFLGVAIAPSTPVNEITEALLSGVKLIERQSVRHDINTVIKNIAFLFPVRSELLSEVAKFKALRLLWYQVVCAYGVRDYNLNDLFLHACSHSVTDQKFQPHGNILNNTLASIAAISGGCNALTVVPEDENNSTMRRISRNTTTILLEESHLGKVNDPFGGSHVVDALTDAIAKTSWEKFQSEIGMI